MPKTFYSLVVLACIFQQANAQQFTSNNVVPHTPDTLIYTYPECTVPINVHVIEEGSGYIILEWEGVAAQPGKTEYLVRWASKDQPDQQKELVITQGRGARIEAIDSEIQYEITVKKICYWGDGSVVPSDPVKVTYHSLAEKLSVLGNCGDTYTFPSCTGPFANQGNWTTLTIGGFQINVLTLQSHDSLNPITLVRETVWDGTGRIQLPFGGRYVKVRWINAYITSAGKICGVVKGISDALGYFPNLSPAPAVWGDEICQAAPSQPGFNDQGIHSETGQPWDPNGFSEDSFYIQQPPYSGWQPGMPYDSMYDPNGFDAMGIHIETGTEFGANGCSQAGVNPYGQPCNPDTIPYYWLQNNPANSEAAHDLLEDVQDSLAIWIQQNLTLWSNTAQDSVASLQTKCTGIRTAMNGLMVSLDYQSDRKLVFGPADIYFNAGMWRQFATPPTKLSVEIDRDTNQVSLEEKHIALYWCDKQLDTYDEFKGLVDSLLAASGGVQNLASIMEDLVLQLSQEQAESFLTNHNAFRQWLKNVLRAHLATAYCDGLCSIEKTPFKVPTQLDRESWGSKDRLPVHHSDPKQIGYHPGSLSSFGIPGWMDLLEIGQEKPEDLLMQQYIQGDEFLNGINRAFYLEAIGDAREFPDRFEHLLTDHDPELMPVDISNRASDGKRYRIWLDQIEFTPNSATLDAYIIIELPNGGKKIAFSALDLSFTPYGLLTTSARLQLANDVVVRMNNAVQITLKAGADTYVSFDCGGYAGIGLNMDVEVCRDYVKPLDPTSLAVLPDPERVRTNILLFFPTFDEVYAEVQIDPFVITDLEDFKWIISGIAVDFSDVKSPIFSAPVGYKSPFVIDTTFSPLWQGFYMRQLLVQMPNQFNSNSAPLNVGVDNLVIDALGVSGKVFASPLLTLNQGNANGWAFSVDEFSMTVLANQIANAKFKGLVHVPIFSQGEEIGGNNLGNSEGGKSEFSANTTESSGSCNTAAPVDKDCFDYSAFIQLGANTGHPIYNMTVNTGSQNWCADMWKAGQVTINSGSQIVMKVADGKFSVVATLSGKVKITNPLSSNVEIKLPDITFQNLIIRNEAPYFTSGIWGFPLPGNVNSSLAGFTLSALNVKMEENNGVPGLSFNAGISVTDGNVGIAAASGGFLINGQMNLINGRQRWVFKDFSIRDIALNGKFGAVTVAGTLSFREGDATYGTCWRGGVSLNVKNLVEVRAVAQFGRIKEPIPFRYFFIDALACLDDGINIAGALKLKGFGGGVYYHMNRPPSSVTLGGTGCVKNPILPSALGASLSGIIYTPDKSKGIGIKATIALVAAAKESAFNGNATVELLFNAGGGISDFWIYGNARFMTDPIIDASSDSITHNGADISASLDIHMNFNTSTLDGNLEVYMNVANGKVHGGGDNDLLGRAIIHVSEENWYVKIGTPSQRCSVVVEVPVIGNIRLGTYLQFGKGLDPIPPLPTEISDLTGNSAYAGLKSSRGAALGGNGFVFGAELSVGERRTTFLKIFYGGLKATLGFDVSLLDYGENAICANTNQQVGMNGWYASGQVYAGVWGELGIKVKVFGKHKEFKIFDIAVATSLQASLPNPFWANGAVGGHYNILGGLIQGQCNFDVTIGERCQIVGADEPLADVAIVQRISPEDSTKSVAVDVRPEVYFNFPIGQVFELGDPNGNNVTYKATLDAVRLRYDGIEIPSTYQWADDRRSLTIESGWILPSNTVIEIVVQSHIDSSNYTIYEEERIARIKTGPGLKHIPPTNVKGSYPLDGQYNFFPDQIVDRKGYILLERGQPDLFWNEPTKLVARFRKSCGPIEEVKLTYDGYQEKIEFDLPNGFFESGSVYRMQIVQKGITSISGGTGNSGGAGNRSAGPCVAEVINLNDEILYTAYFRVSQYATFGAKIDAWNSTKQNLSYDYSRVLRAQAIIEPFDETEINSEGLGIAADFRANLSGNSWYNNDIKSLIPQGSTSCINTPYCLDPNRPPADRAIRMKPASGGSFTPVIIKEHWLAGTAPGAASNWIMYYRVPQTFGYEWSDIKFKVSEHVNSVLGNIVNNPGCNGSSYALCASNCNAMTTYEKAIFCGQFPEPPNGQYTVIIRYRLPGASLWDWSAEKVISLQK